MRRKVGFKLSKHPIDLGSNSVRFAEEEKKHAADVYSALCLTALQSLKSTKAFRLATCLLSDDDELPAAYQHESAYGARTWLDGMSINLSAIPVCWYEPPRRPPQAPAGSSNPPDAS